jgi:hypothetical protein
MKCRKFELVHHFAALRRFYTGINVHV